MTDYIHLPDSTLAEHARGNWGAQPMSVSLLDQATRDVKAVIAARKKGEHWAWRRTALLSAFDKKDDFANFAKELVALGWRIMSSGGTAKYLNDMGIKAWDVAGIVGEPILEHRVVTLSRELHAALLARPDVQKDRDELKRLNVPFIDLVYVNMYPLRQEIAKKDCTLQSVIEKTDIGGPTMLRSACKGRRIAICRPSEFKIVLKYIRGEYYKQIMEMCPDREDVKKAQEKARLLDERIISGLASIVEGEISDYCHASCEYHRKIASSTFWNVIVAGA